MKAKPIYALGDPNVKSIETEGCLIRVAPLSWDGLVATHLNNSRFNVEEFLKKYNSKIKKLNEVLPRGIRK